MADTAPGEFHFARQTCDTFAVPGVVENGLVRLLDASVKLPKRSRVIIVSSDGQRLADPQLKIPRIYGLTLNAALTWVTRSV